MIPLPCNRVKLTSTKSVWGAYCSPYLSGGCICLQFSSLFCVGVTTYCTSIKRTGNFVPSLAHGSWKCWSCTVNVVCILYESFDSQNHLIEYLYQCIIIYLYRKSSLHGVPYPYFECLSIPSTISSIIQNIVPPDVIRPLVIGKWLWFSGYTKGAICHPYFLPVMARSRL